MRAQVEVLDNYDYHEFADIRIAFNGSSRSCKLHFDFDVFSKRLLVPKLPLSLEFLYFASAIYAIDRMVDRIKETADGWTREFDVTIPVAVPDKWEIAKDLLENRISFLTGDIWRFTFTPLAIPLCKMPSRRLKTRKKRMARNYGTFEPEAVGLLSGGLDSFIGSIDWLEQNKSKSIFLVGHHDGSGPEKQQKDLVAALKAVYKQRCDSIHLRAGIQRGSNISDGALDHQLRSRSIIFLALGVLCANQFGPEIPLIIPENGTIALNPPLTPARKGSLSTRTCHPYFIEGIKDVLVGLDIKTPVINPLSGKTKGECVEQCLNRLILTQTAAASVSCGKAGRRGTWSNTSANACGRCVPCIYRRSALHKVGLDNQSYGTEICDVSRDELYNSSTRGWDDLKAILSFLRNNKNENDLRKVISARAVGVGYNQINNYMSMITSAMNEIRQLLRDKATDDIKRLAGLVND
jgi:hypothetical protein